MIPTRGEENWKLIMRGIIHMTANNYIHISGGGGVAIIKIYPKTIQTMTLKRSQSCLIKHFLVDKLAVRKQANVWFNIEDDKLTD